MIFVAFNQINKHKRKVHNHRVYTLIIIKKRMITTHILKLQIVVSHLFYQHELCFYTFLH